MRLPELLALFLPDWFALPLLVGLGLAVIVGLVRPRHAARIVGVGIALYLLAPFVEALVTALLLALPWWVAALLLLSTALAVTRGVLSALLGREAAGHVLGAFVVWLLAGAARTGVALVRAVFRLAARWRA